MVEIKLLSQSGKFLSMLKNHLNKVSYVTIMLPIYDWWFLTNIKLFFLWFFLAAALRHYKQQNGFDYQKRTKHNPDIPLRIEPYQYKDNTEYQKFHCHTLRSTVSMHFFTSLLNGIS